MENSIQSYRRRFVSYRSLDHLVRPCEHVGRNRQADLLGRFQIDDELELLRLLHREIGWLSTLQNLVHIRGGAAEQVVIVRAVVHEPARFDILRSAIGCWQPMFYREVNNLFSMSIEDGVPEQKDCIGASLDCGSEHDV